MTTTLSKTPVIETDRLILRAPMAEDWPHWRRMAFNPRAEFITEDDMTEGKAWRAMGHMIGHWVLRGWGSFVITHKGDNTALGVTGPWFPAGWPEPELGWALWDDTLEGTGLAFEAAKAGRAYAFETLGWTTAVSYIHERNARSIALAERLGATLDSGAPAPHSDDVVYRHAAPQEVA